MNYLPRNSFKPIRITPRITPLNNIIQHLRIAIQRGVNKPQWRFSHGHTLAVDSPNHSRKDRRGGTCPRGLVVETAIEYRSDVLAHGCDVGDAAPQAIEAAVAVGAAYAGERAVVLVGGVGGRIGVEIARYSGFLVVGEREIVGEAAAGRIVGGGIGVGGDAFGEEVQRGVGGRELGAADCGDPGASIILLASALYVLCNSTEELLEISIDPERR